MTDLPRAPVDRFEAAEDVLTDALEREEAPVARKMGGREALIGRIAGSRELATVVVCILLFVFFTIGNPKYASVDIFLGIARRISLIGILAVPMTYLMIAGELDLSAGANLTFSSVLFAELASQERRDPWLSMFLVLLAGAAIGAINGFLTVRVGLSSFIATLGMLAALQGGAEVLTGGVGTYAKDTNQPFYDIMSGNVLGTRIPDMFAMMVVVMIIGGFVLAKTKFGSDCYATGGNPEAARNNGIDTGRIRFTCFCLVGLLAGLSGVIQFGWIQSTSATSGITFELQVIAAMIIGGVGLFGGRGSILGAFLGGIILSMLTSGLIMIGVGGSWDGVASGLVIVVAVGLDLLVRGGAARSLARVVQAET